MKGQPSCKRQVLETHDALAASGNFSTHEITTKTFRTINNKKYIYTYIYIWKGESKRIEGALMLTWSDVAASSWMLLASCEYETGYKENGKYWII